MQSKGKKSKATAVRTDLVKAVMCVATLGVAAGFIDQLGPREFTENSIVFQNWWILFGSFVCVRTHLIAPLTWQLWVRFGSGISDPKWSRAHGPRPGQCPPSPGGTPPWRPGAPPCRRWGCSRAPPRRGRPPCPGWSSAPRWSSRAPRARHPRTLAWFGPQAPSPGPAKTDPSHGGIFRILSYNH